MKNWKNIININQVEYKADPRKENYRHESAPLATEMGAVKLGFHLEILQPKSFSCPYHFHHSEEELFLVMEGEAILRQDNQFKKVGPGDLVFFKNGPEGAHQFYNHSDKPFRFLALSTMDEMEVCEYPDSGKLFVAKTRKVFQQNQSVDYWSGEEDPKRFWPKEYL